MSDQLPEHELELMALFDKGLSLDERERLIERLQAYPELIEKYGFYLHLQDLDLASQNNAPPRVRRTLLKAAKSQATKNLWYEKLLQWSRSLVNPMVTGPAILCLVFFAGYELLDKPKTAKRTLLGQTSKTSKNESDRIRRKPSLHSEIAKGDRNWDLDTSETQNKHLENNLSQLDGAGTASARTPLPLRTTSSADTKFSEKTKRSSPRRRSLAKGRKPSWDKTGDRVKRSISKQNLPESINDNKDSTQRTKRIMRRSGAPNKDHFQNTSRRRTSKKVLDEVHKESMARVDSKQRSASPMEIEIRNHKIDEKGASALVEPQPPEASAHDTPDSLGLELVADDPPSHMRRSAKPPSQKPSIPSAKSTSKRLAKTLSQRKFLTRNKEMGVARHTPAVSPQKRLEFNDFIQRFNTPQSLSEVQSSKLMDMSNIAYALGDWDRSQRWARHVFNRSDKHQKDALFLLEKIRKNKPSDAQK